MTSALKVLQPGLSSTVQDLGRSGFQRFGIPVSGAADPTALRAANVVVGNAPSTAGLEIVLMGPTLEVAAESVRVAVAGSGAAIEVHPVDGADRRLVPALESVRLVRGDKLRVPPLSGTAVACLAIAGGFDLVPFQGSHATYVRGGFGGLDGRALQAGDLLPLGLDSAPDRAEATLDGVSLAPATIVRVVLGPQDDHFTPAAIETLLAAEYTVSREADRMGMRLDGPRLAHANGFDIVSDGIAPGAIQVPGSGQPIVLLADRQSTGGYPKIATVASVDLPALGRCLPGMRLRFTSVSVGAAQALRREHEAMMRSLPGRLRPVRAPGIDLSRLASENLVSGVIDAIGRCDPA